MRVWWQAIGDATNWPEPGTEAPHGARADFVSPQQTKARLARNAPDRAYEAVFNLDRRRWLTKARVFRRIR